MQIEGNQVNKSLLKQVQDGLKEKSTFRTLGRKRFKGRGIVTCAGGYRYFTNAWVLIRMLRYLGCTLPIEVWHLGTDEMSDKMKRLLSKYDVQCIDALSVIDNDLRCEPSHLGSNLRGAVMANSSFEEVMFLDADNLAVRDPSYLFESSEYKSSSALFWPSAKVHSKSPELWEYLGVRYVAASDFDCSQIVVNKRNCYVPLSLFQSLSLHPELISRFPDGATSLLPLAWHKSEKPYHMPSVSPQMLSMPDPLGETRNAVICQHDFTGERLFQHRAFCKWDLLGTNPWVSGFFYESQCRDFLGELKSHWNGRCKAGVSLSSTPNLRPIRNTLLNKTWMLEIPQAFLTRGDDAGSLNDDANDLKDDVPDFVKTPESIGKINIQAFHVKQNKSALILAKNRRQILKREIGFASNGTIKNGATMETGYFWEFAKDSGKVQLLLLGDRKEIAKLDRVSNDHWEGHWTSGPATGERAAMRSVRGVYPHLYALPKRRWSRDSREIVRSLGSKAHVTCSARSLGDDISAICACTGLARLGVSVTFHTPSAASFSRVVQPGLTITSKGYKSCIDLNYDFGNMMRFGESKSAWYAAALHPLVKPAPPTIDVSSFSPRFPFKNYIILAPFGSPPYALWPESHWTRLANLLRSRGYELVAIGQDEHHAPGLLRIFSRTQAYWVVGHPPEWVSDALLGAAACIGADNDISHLAAFLGVNTIAIHAQFSGAFLWPQGRVRSVTPQTDCAFCRFQEERGYLEPCSSGCSALATISPERVIKALSETLK